MSDHLKNFYTLEEVKNKLAASTDPQLSSDLTIKRFIDTHLLTPYVHYKGLINSVRSVYSKSREDIIKELSATINEDINILELKELVDPQRYDASLDIDAIIYQTKKLLTTFKDEYAMGNDGFAPYVEGIFSISSNNVMHTNLGLKVIIGDYEPISHHIKFISKNPFGNMGEDDYAALLREDEVFGWVLHMPDSDYHKAIKPEKQCKLIFSSQDVSFILRRIENIDLAPKLAKKLKKANRLISQQLAQIENLNNKLSSEKPTKELHIRSANNAGKIISALASELLELNITKPYSEKSNGAIRKAIELQGNNLSEEAVASWLKIAYEQIK
ncbi:MULTISPECIES: hypothetical protein [unclassified Psychrobacter]|uniref:hypothetical protein n=1 Tax=unclassified Psychrobacter TaxID=196806 RepID=UPI003F47DDBA